MHKIIEQLERIHKIITACRDKYKLPIEYCRLRQTYYYDGANVDFNNLFDITPR